MLDDISTARLAEVHPELARRTVNFAALLSFDIRVVQGRRSWQDQDALYQKGRSVPGEPCTHDGVVRPVGTCNIHPRGLIVTKARPEQCAHCFLYAIDAAPIVHDVVDWSGEDEKWAEMLAKAPSCGLAEGAQWRTFPDTPHFYLQELPATPDQEMVYTLREGGYTALTALIDERLQKTA